MSRDPLIALKQAQRVRAQRTRLHHMVRAPHDQRKSRALVAGLLVTPQRALRRMHAVELLGWSWGMSDQVAERMLDRAGASTVKTVGDLTVRQLHVIRDLLIAPDDSWMDDDDAR